jgi:hypothetical protein
MKYGQRFRYNNLTQTYAKYKDIFRKRLKQKEEGSVQRHFGAAAKAIEAERAKRLAEANARYATAVSSDSPGRITVRFGIARSEASCSTGWWVGPSSPSAMLSCVNTCMT